MDSGYLETCTSNLSIPVAHRLQAIESLPDFILGDRFKATGGEVLTGEARQD